MKVHFIFYHLYIKVAFSGNYLLLVHRILEFRLFVPPCCIYCNSCKVGPDSESEREEIALKAISFPVFRQ